MVFLQPRSRVRHCYRTLTCEPAGLPCYEQLPRYDGMPKKSLLGQTTFASLADFPEAVRSSRADASEEMLPRLRINCVIAWATPSSSFEPVTKFASDCTSLLALPIAILIPLFLNIRTSLGISPSVAILVLGK